MHDSNEKNIQLKPPVKFGINVTGFQGINCNSYMEVNIKNNAFHFLITLCQYRIKNMENTTGKQLINDAITNENLSDKEIKKYLSLKSLKRMELINKINNELYNDNSQQITIEKIQKICQKESNENSRKIWNEKRSRLLNNLLNPKIKEITSKERKINIILDNAKIHHAKIVEKACEILNINFIFLAPYCPDLNPIEDIWRKIKSKIYKSLYVNLNELTTIFKDEFYKIVDLKSFYENWVKEYLGINIW